MPLELINGDIVKQKTDIIVNAANSELLAGGGVCGAIFKAAGYQKLQKACDEIGFCACGQAVYTPGFDLCKYIIHTVGPIWQGGKCQEKEDLISAYQKSLELASKLEVESIAFPLISTGIYGYPAKEAFKVAVETIEKYILDHDDLIVRLVIYGNVQIYQSADHQEIYKQLDFSKVIDAFEFTTVNYVSRLDSRKNRHEDKAIVTHMMASSNMAPKFEITNLSEQFVDVLYEYMNLKEMNAPELYRRSNIDRRHFSKIINSKGTNVSKATILALAIGLRLNKEEANRLLKTRGHCLSDSLKSDVIVSYYIDNQNYNIFDLNEMLFTYGEKPLGYRN